MQRIFKMDNNLAKKKTIPAYISIIKWKAIESVEKFWGEKS